MREMREMRDARVDVVRRDSTRARDDDAGDDDDDDDDARDDDDDDARGDSRLSLSVSYTHLTLPTILLV